MQNKNKKTGLGLITQTIFIAFLLSACLSNGSRSESLIQTQSPPAEIQELTFTSNGSRLAGFIYIAAGKGPHPTVVLLHGYPGNEKNLDLAQALRQDGWNVVFFHYRGAWGSEGEFSFRNAESDAQNVISYLQEQSNSDKLRVDPKRISTIGHSMGGHMSLAALFDNPSLVCGVALDGANLGANGGEGLIKDRRMGKIWRDYSDTLFMLNGWSGEKAVQEMELFGKEIDLIPRAKDAADRPILLIAADTKIIPLETHIKPLESALKQSSNHKVEFVLIKDDHSFSSSRSKLIATIIDFMKRNCR